MLWRTGVLAPLGAGGAPVMELYLSGTCPEVEPMLFSCGGWPGTPSSGGWAPALPGGSGLFRRSLSVDVDDDGVSTGDWLESRDEADGDEVPSLPSLLILEALPESLPRESWRRRQSQHISSLRRGERQSRWTNHFLAEAPHLRTELMLSSGGGAESPCGIRRRGRGARLTENCPPKT